MAGYSSQFAWDNASEPEGDDIPDFVIEDAQAAFEEEWLCHTEIPEKAMSVLTKFATGEKPNDLELHVFKNELNHAYEIALQHYTDDYVASWLKNK